MEYNNINIVGVIGAGKFGISIIRLLSKNTNVLVYVRSKNSLKKVEDLYRKHNITLPSNVNFTLDIHEIAKKCTIIFPVVPAASFKDMIKELSKTLTHKHILIHGTKGFAIKWPKKKSKSLPRLKRDDIKTMSEIIAKESTVKKIGCIAGPNLSLELLQGQPAATVIASNHKSVISIGRQLLKSSFFQVYGSKDILGVELCGALKNIIAIAAGGLKGMGYGDNSKALLISRGIIEMMYIGKFMGSSIKPFLGLAGIGDLVATCSSELSRNFRLGYRMAQGEKLQNIVNDIGETIEGVNTVKVIYSLSKSYKIKVPITTTMYKVIFKNLDVNAALRYLVNYPIETDVEFI